MNKKDAKIPGPYGPGNGVSKIRGRLRCNLCGKLINAIFFKCRCY